MRRATNSRYTRNQGRRISIHALHEEGDNYDMVQAKLCMHFYPRPP